jgi:PII-like signaling protein
MRLDGEGTRLTIIVGESHQYHHHPLYTEIVHRAHRAKLAGAAVFRGVEGYGSTGTIHTSRILSLAGDLPVMIVIVDTDERVRAFVDELETLVSRATCLLEPVRVVRFTDDEPDAR